MEFRLAEEKDTLAIKKLWSYSFESYQPYFDWYFHTIYSPQRTLGLWEKENLLASLQLAPYKMQIRGQALDCNYIVGVITSPACRGRHIGWQLMQEALAYLQKNSLPLAVLKPAASDFYYKLGFSFCYEDIIWKMPLLSIKNLLPPKNEALIQWQAIDIIDIPQNIIFLDQIFQGMNQNPAHKLNGYILRNQMNWQNYLEEHLGDGCRCWLMKRNGLPAAYLLFLLKDKQFQLREMAFIDFQAQKEAFAFIYGHQNEAENFIWTAPSWDKSYLQLTYQNGLALHPSKMGKIIHIPQTLSLISYPANLNLHIHFTVENDIISVNNGSYLLDINAGRGQIKNISQKSFLIIDVHGLNNLIWGFRSAWDLARMGHIQGSAQDIDNLAQAFPLCNNFLYEES